MYKVEFEITVTNAGSGYANVFHFTAHNNDNTNGNSNYGSRIPAFFIHGNGFFHICSAINGDKNYCQNFDFELGKQYQIKIRQFITSGTYWYQIMIDDELEFQIANTQPQSFSNVMLYTSNPWNPSFWPSLGSICNVKIQQEKG